jgi:hypothetical protein
VIDYQFRQLPTKPILTSPEWEEIFFPFNPVLPTVDAAKHTRDAMVTGLTKVLTWELDEPAILHGIYVDFDEFGYNQNGYVCRLEQDPAEVTSATVSRQPSQTGGYLLRPEIEEHMVGLSEVVGCHGR